VTHKSCASWLLLDTLAKPTADPEGKELDVVGKEILRLADELAQETLRNDPFHASYMGVAGYDDAVGGPVAGRRQRWRDTLVGILLRCDLVEAQVDRRTRMTRARSAAGR
jgi:hypothetical protein